MISARSSGMAEIALLKSMKSRVAMRYPPNKAVRRMIRVMVAVVVSVENEFGQYVSKQKLYISVDDRPLAVGPLV